MPACKASVPIYGTKYWRIGVSNYWTRTVRLNRRKFLLGAGAGIASAAFLAACGGDDDDGTGSGTTNGTGSGTTNGTGSGTTNGQAEGTSGLLAAIVDESSQAKKGGTFVIPGLEPPHFDGKAQGHVQQLLTNSLAYESLVRNKPGIGEPSTFTELLPELATSWEFSGDNLQLTFKLREGVKFHNRPPVNGRPFDSEDVVKTWEIFTAPGNPNNATASANILNPSAPVLSMEAPDARTVIVKLAYPAGFILQRFANMYAGELGAIYPKESRDTFDPQHDQIGTGPFELDEFVPSSRVVHRRFEDHWDPNHGFLDRIEIPLLLDPSAQLAQFQTGALSTMNVAPELVLSTKDAAPDLELYQWLNASMTTGIGGWRFGWLPKDGKPSPFLDERVRQAVSMSIDRTTHLDTLHNVTNFNAAGIPVQAYWHSPQGGGVPGAWLDPEDEGRFGENARFYQYNLEEARKLLDAAESDYGSPFSAITSRFNAASYGPQYEQEHQVLDQFVRELGLEVETVGINYSTDWIPNFATKRGDFDGIVSGGGALTSEHPIDYYLWRFYSPTGGTSGMIYGGSFKPDPQVDSLIEKARGEFDTDSLIDIIHQLQRILAGYMYFVPPPGRSDSMDLVWPAIRDFRTVQGDTRYVTMDAPGIGNYWYDDTKSHG